MAPYRKCTYLLVGRRVFSCIDNILHYSFWSPSIFSLRVVGILWTNVQTPPPLKHFILIFNSLMYSLPHLRHSKLGFSTYLHRSTSKMCRTCNECFLPAYSNCAILLSQKHCPEQNWYIAIFLHSISLCKIT
jgi:hypothetical protein